MKKIKNYLRMLLLILAVLFIIPIQVPSISARAQAATVKLNKTKLTLTKGEKYNLKIKGTDEKVDWSSSKKTVATVSKKGVVTAKKVGNTTITATVGDDKFTCKVKVKEPDVVIEKVELENHVIVIAKNNTKKAKNIEICIEFFDKEDRKIFSSTKACSNVGANMKAMTVSKKALRENGMIGDYDTYKISYKVEDARDKEFCYDSSILKTKVTKLDNKYIYFDVDSKHKEKVDVCLNVLYYYKNKVVGYLPWYIEDTRLDQVKNLKIQHDFYYDRPKKYDKAEIIIDFIIPYNYYELND